MRYVIAYDIEDDRTRGRVADRLERCGARVQQSLFECTLTPTELRKVIDAMQELLDPNAHDSVRVYRLCADCLKSSVGIGDIDGGFRASPWIVV